MREDGLLNVKDAGQLHVYAAQRDVNHPGSLFVGGKDASSS
jgi:hypothetical protein